ncbi:hypothetical protein D9M69_565280 [compost metagenome]
MKASSTTKAVPPAVTVNWRPPVLNGVPTVPEPTLAPPGPVTLKAPVPALVIVTVYAPSAAVVAEAPVIVPLPVLSGSAAEATCLPVAAVIASASALSSITSMPAPVMRQSRSSSYSAPSNSREVISSGIFSRAVVCPTPRMTCSPATASLGTLLILAYRALARLRELISRKLMVRKNRSTREKLS